jgi:hypothetical protein
MNIKKLAIDASANFTSEWYRMHEDHFAIECECDSLDAVDGEFYLEYGFDHAATEGIEVEDSRQTLDAADKHFCIRNSYPLNADWIRFVYSKGSNTTGTINVRGNT